MPPPAWTTLRDKDVRDRAEALVRLPVRPKTEGQKALAKAILENTLTFGWGPPGTGKTLLPCLIASKLLRDGHVDKIILTRPLVTCGEELGFMPGDQNDKTQPYRGHLDDAFGSVLGEDVAKLTRSGQLVFQPLAFLRGTTFRRSFVLLDEAQNATEAQLRMFLTRLGEEPTKAVVSGDPLQSDIGRSSGLMKTISLLRGMPGAAFVELGEADICRSGIVREIERRFRESYGQEEMWATGEETHDEREAADEIPTPQYGKRNFPRSRR